MGRKESKLFDYCRWNEPNDVIKFLKKERDIDLTYDDGIHLAFAIKHKSPKMLNALIEYFEQTKLQGDINTLEYKTALYTLKKMLQHAVNMFEVSPEIQEILDKYIPEDDSSDDEAKLPESEHSSGDEHQLVEPARIFDNKDPQTYSDIRKEGLEFLELLERNKDNPHLKTLRIKKITLPEDLSDIQKVHKTLKTFLNTLHSVEMALGEFVEDKQKISTADMPLLKLNDLSEQCQTDLTSFLKNIETQSPYLLDYENDERNSDEVLLIGDIDLGNQENHLKEI